jgi:hypothetical protein
MSSIAESYGKNILAFVRAAKLSCKVAVLFAFPSTKRERERVPVAPHPYQQLVLSMFGVLAIQIGV